MDWPVVLREYRHAKRLKQEALGDLFGFTQSAVSQWERGKRPPPERVQLVLRGFEADRGRRRVISSSDVWSLVRRSVQHCPNPALLFKFDGAELRFETISDGTYDAVPGMPRVAPGVVMRDQFGEFIEHTHRSLIESGAFRDDLLVAKAVHPARISGRFMRCQTNYTPMYLDDGFWALRVDSVVDAQPRRPKEIEHRTAFMFR